MMMRRYTLHFVAASGLALLLSACGGGGGTSVATEDDAPDPVVVDVPIAYIKRPAPEPENGAFTLPGLEDPIAMTPGARLYIRPRSSNLAEEIDLTDRIVEIIAAELDADPELLALDIKGLDASFDGNLLVFAVRAIPDIENNNEPELYTWNLWQYNLEEDTLSYLIDSPLVRNEGALAGGGHDIDPHLLTDDRIVFSSSRQSAVQEKQLNEGRGQRYSPLAEDSNTQAMGLHAYDPDSGDITQISVSRTADLEPATLESGEIIFSRRGNNGRFSLYRIHPSGARHSLLYGANSNEPLADEESVFGVGGELHFLRPHQLPDGRIMSLMAPLESPTLGGDIALIDTDGFVELFTPVDGSSGDTARAQTALTDLDVNALDEFSPGGKFLDAYPLRDGTDRVLVSWSPCRIVTEEELIKPCSIAEEDDRQEVDGGLQFVSAPPLFGLWLYDPTEGTQQPVVLAEEGRIIAEVVAAEPRTYPQAPDETGLFDPELAVNDKGLIIIDSVYNEDEGLVDFANQPIAAYAEPGTAAYTQRPARFLRILQPVPEPNDEVLDDVPNSGGRFGLLEILGYVPVEPDGSASVIVPANTPLMLNTLLANGRRISDRHDHWLQVAPGEILHCVGCHDPNSDVPHGRLDAQPPSQNPGAIGLASGTTGFPGTDPAFVASEPGQTMAEVYDLHRPVSLITERVRELALQLTYSDEWTDTGSGLTPDPDIDLSYDPTWDIDPAHPIISPNLDPSLQGRIVIHYDDHIQPIWERERTITLDGSEVLGLDGTAATNCVSCHTSLDNTVVPAGQLDLTDAATDNELFTRSYLELTRNDNEEWIDDNGGISDRTRICTVIDEEGNELQQVITFDVPAPVRRGSARGSQAFFDCFEGDDPDQCGRFVQDQSTPPANCTDDGGTVTEDGTVTTKTLPEDFTAAQDLMDAKDDPADDNSPSLTDAGELFGLLQANCSSCHDDDADADGAENFPHSDPDDNDIAYTAILNEPDTPYINLVNPSASTFVFRLETLNHSCWSGDCEADAEAMTAAIASFADAVPEEEVENNVPGGTVTPEASFNHQGLLDDNELRLISEWLDIGAPFYNDPFDPRLSD